MPSRCIVAGCGNTSKDGVSLHRFPTDLKYRNIWTERVQRGRPTWAGPSQHSVVCSAHFDPSCYDTGLYMIQFDIHMKQTLLRHAIPTIFPGCTDADRLIVDKTDDDDRNIILDEALCLGQTCKQDVSRGRFSPTKQVPIPVSIIRVCEDNKCNHFPHPQPNAHTHVAVETVCAERKPSFKIRWHEEEVVSSTTQPTSGKQPSKVIKMTGVTVLRGFVNSNEQLRQSESDVHAADIAEETDLRPGVDLCSAPVLKPQQHTAQPHTIDRVSGPCPHIHVGTSVQDNVETVRIERQGRCPTPSDQWQKDWRGQNDESQNFALQGDQIQTLCTVDMTDQPSEDSSNHETSKEDVHDEELNVRALRDHSRDHSSDENYVLDATISVSIKQKEVSRRALGTRSDCWTARVDCDVAEHPTDGMEGNHMSESVEEDGGQEHEVPSCSSDKEEDVLSSSRDLDELQQRENQSKKRKCDAPYQTKCSLCRNEMACRGQKGLICEQCRKQFFRGNIQKAHRIIHLEEKPYMCSECGRGFSQKSNMMLHLRMHTGARPYECDVCEKAFNHNISLKTHQKKAHGIDWWKDNKLTAVS